MKVDDLYHRDSLDDFDATRHADETAGYRWCDEVPAGTSHSDARGEGQHEMRHRLTR